LCISFKKRQFLKTVNRYFFEGALDRDRFANRNYRTGLNFWLSTGGYQFGNPLETMSSVLGKKGLEKTLSRIGWFVYYFLYAIDYTAWKKGGHCFDSINNEI
jgi:hypothetical protein